MKHHTLRWPAITARVAAELGTDQITRWAITSTAGTCASAFM